jgi:hypothetical protein
MHYKPLVIVGCRGFPSRYRMWVRRPTDSRESLRRRLIAPGSLATCRLGTAAPQQLIEHWDDAAWSLVSMPDVDSPSALYAVSASSGSDVWAVGSAGNNTLIEHWDGSAWSRVPSPNGDGQSQLLSVDALASNDVWADGFSIASGSGSEPLLLHWDGVSWNAVPNTQPSLQNLFTGISGSQSDDVWAVGSAYYPPSNSEVQLAERWNGVDWEVVRGPGSQTVLGGLNDVVALSPSDVWVAVTTGGPRFGAVLHWDGSTLTQVNLPWSAGKLAASSANDVWAAGSGLQHRDGNEWRTVIAGYPGDDSPESPSLPTSRPMKCGRLGTPSSNRGPRPR